MNRQTILKNLGASSSVPVLVAENQDVRDIINLIKHKHIKCAEDYDRISGFFWQGSVYDTCKFLFDFCKKNIAYQVESEEIQTVSQPAVILSKGEGDCKHYALFIAGVLDSLKRKGKKIDWFYRFASYNPFDNTPGHVFVVCADAGEEIWIDPVLSEFNYHKSFFAAIDKKIPTGAAKVGAVNQINKVRTLGLSKMKGMQCVGATTAQTGQLIMKVAPALAVVPVVGWIAAAGGEVVGFFLSSFGSNYSQSTQVRWLVQLYQYYVLNQPGITSDNKVNESYTANAQNWFAIVLGVPIYDRLRFNTLKGVSSSNGQSLNQSYSQRANLFLQYPDVKQAGVTYDQALQAAMITDQLSLSAPAGGWAQMTAAPSLIDTSAVEAQAGLTSGAALINPSGGVSNFFGNLASKLNVPIWVIYGGLAAIVLLLFSSSSHKKERA